MVAAPNSFVQDDIELARSRTAGSLIRAQLFLRRRRSIGFENGLGCVRFHWDSAPTNEMKSALPTISRVETATSNASEVLTSHHHEKPEGFDAKTADMRQIPVSLGSHATASRKYSAGLRLTDRIRALVSKKKRRFQEAGFDLGKHLG